MLVCRVVCSFGGGVSWCPLGGRWSAFEDSGPAIGRLWSSGGVFHAFCPLSCFACGALHLNMALFRVLRGFLEGFMVRIYIYMGLGFCVDCGAFVCVSG